MERKSKAPRPDADRPSSARDLREQGKGGTRRRRITDFDPESVVTELATSAEDLGAAYRLVYERYLSEGYQAPTPGKLRFITHCCLPESYTFVARCGGEIVATLSLIKDRELGLPLEKEYRHEIQVLRSQGRELAEVSCLATREGVDQSVVLQLIRTMYSYARYRAGVTDWVIAVNPKQRRFYSRGLLFQPFGVERDYGACEGAPAVALITDITDWEERMVSAHGRGMLGRFYGREGGLAPFSERLGLPGVAELNERLRFAEGQMLIQGTDSAVRACIRSAYVARLPGHEADPEVVNEDLLPIYA